MIKYATRALVVAVILMVPAVSYAQQRTLEVSPYFGWRHGNDLTDVSGISVDLESGTAFGFMVDIYVTPRLQVEFIYSYFDTTGELIVPPNLPEIGPVGTFAVSGTISHYQGGLLYQWDLDNPNIKPFIVGTMGAVNSNPDQADGNTKLAFSGGGGIKVYFGRNFGIRGEYRLFSQDTNFTGRGGWCDWWGFCYTFLTNKYLYQSQFSLAAIIGF